MESSLQSRAMPSRRLIYILVAAAMSTAASARAEGLQPGRVALRIEMGLKDEDNTRWDGSIRVSQGTVARIEHWRKGPQDSIDGNAWRMVTRPAPRFHGSKKVDKEKISECGVLVQLDGATEETQVDVTTKQGSFKFKLSDVPYGTRFFRLQGAARVARMPVSYHLTVDGTEEDYPSAAVGSDGTVYVAYVAFTHGKDFAKRIQKLDTPDISNLAEPTGGDRLLVIAIRDGQWAAPMPVTPGGEDLYKSAIAVDGRGRPWVFWSARTDDFFHLFASRLQDGKWTAPQRVGGNAGSDICPAAACDAGGNVWVVWQGVRGEQAKILAAKQQGDALGAEQVIAAEAGNQWDPAIATSRAGDVAVAWDTYVRGNYDVCLRIAKAGGPFGPIVPVAATLREEVHAALAYDPAGPLWVAWEQGPERWGKDFGALVKDKGSPLYSGLRRVAVKCFDGAQVFETTASLEDALTLGPANKPGAKPKVKPAARRAAGEERVLVGKDPLSYPRLAVDAAGRVWLAARSKQPVFWCNVGTAWTEQLTCFDGKSWLKPIYVHHTDNILDNRPALVALPDGSVLMANSADGRQQVSGYGGAMQKEIVPGKADPVNNDLYLQQFRLPGEKIDPPQLTAVTLPAPEPADAAAERAAIDRCRGYRLQAGGQAYRLMRGEFHRHTELSTDGGGDGALTDMYRYSLDAVGFDWVGCGDHDNNNGREYPWWITQKTADAYRVGSTFMPMFSYERSVTYPDGHRNVIFAHRGVRTLTRYGVVGTGRDDQQPAHTPDTLLLYKYLAQYDGVCASHSSATDMGTDWRDNDPKVEPIVEIYQGCRQNYEEPHAPRAPTADDAIGGWRPAGFVWRALEKGYRLGFQSSSDHVSTHISFCSVWAAEPTRAAILDGLKARRVYGATDNIVADVRCGEHVLGEEFTLAGKPTFQVKLLGTAPFKQVDIVRNNAYVYTTKPGKAEVDFRWTDMTPPSGTAYYYVRGEQEDGELVWVSPMWITFQ